MSTSNLKAQFVSLFLVLLAAPLGHAIVITNDTTIGVTDSTYDGQDIVVSNAVLTVDGPHALNSLRLAAGSTLTHSASTNTGLDLTLTNSFELEAGAMVNLDACGALSSNSTNGAGASAGSPPSGGGGGHGGDGGLSSSNSAGGIGFDSPIAPLNVGGGGGAGSGGAGGAGGGAMRLSVGGECVLNGLVTANGQNATNTRSGGGAGGSILIAAQTISGNGTLSARGGAGEPIHGGGGGGGRIALHLQTNLFTGNIQLTGGAGWQRGGPGTLNLATNAAPGWVTIDDGGSTGAPNRVDFSLTNATLEVRGRVTAMAASGVTQLLNNLILRSNTTFTTTSTNFSTLSLAVSNNALMEAGATIQLAGRGYSPDAGLGLGALSSGGALAGGSGHGGYGGDYLTSVSTLAGGNGYGSITTPTNHGTGGRSISSSGPGGAGGGAVRMIVAGVLQMDGRINVEATSALGPSSGGASGGSVWLSLGTFSGGGSISANGGAAGSSSAGGGGGGRIAVTFATNLFSGVLSALGGDGASKGGAGTIYTKGNAEVFGDLLADNGGVRGTNTVLNSNGPYNLRISGNAVGRLTVSSMLLSNAFIADGSGLMVGNGSAGISITNQGGTMTISSGAFISGDGIGDYFGAGRGVASAAGASGGGHGGYGGNGTGTTNGGDCTGGILQPSRPGGNGGLSNGTGGAGGAALLMACSYLVLNGKLTANGSSPTNVNAGGGAGGSIYLIISKALSGAGSISADGANGDLPKGGGGGGGRIAIYYSTNNFTGSLSARGGLGFQAGGAGTIYVRNYYAVAGGPYNDYLIVDNGGLNGTNTMLTSDGFSNLVVRGAAKLTVVSYSALTFWNFRIETNSMIQTPVNSGALTLTLRTTGYVAAGGSIFANATGYGSAPGLGSTYSFASGGGGHGGFGGDFLGYGGEGAGNGGWAHDSLVAPVAYGGAGGGDYGSGGRGGGVIRISGNGTLILDGTISANGESAVTNRAGGGAGGSVWLTLNQLSGTGAITADGGSGQLPNAGGGGGGRISVSYNYFSNDFAGTFSVKGGNGGNRGGAGTIYLLTNGASVATVITDNGGFRGAGTSVFGTNSFDLTVRGGAIAGSLGSPRDLFVRSNSFIGSSAVTVLRDAVIESGGGLNFDNGYLHGTGSGTQKAGASHGGYGAGNPSSSAPVYGSATAPTTVGSQGGSGSSSSHYVSLGGGSTHWTVGNTLTINGTISANGSGGELNSGGGSGGSVWLEAPTIAGSGVVSACGGDGNNLGGGGGGGRIAIYYATNLFIGTISACGGSGSAYGGAGTIYFRDTLQRTSMLLDNCGHAGTNTPLSTTIGLATNLTVTGGAVAEFPSQGAIPAFSNLVTSAGGLVTTRTSNTNLFLTLLGDLTMNSGSGFRLNGKGYYAFNVGPGVGATLANQGAGGGYGGAGGASASGAAGGLTYGSDTKPVHYGSAGGAGTGPIAGREGGGALRLSVLGTVLADGVISANGSPGIQDDSGGGAGGSIWITAGKFTGVGTLAANGGDGDFFNGGGGGGGRIAIYSSMNTFTGAVSVAGGFGAANGGAGTIFTAAELLIAGKVTDTNGAAVAGVTLQPSGGLLPTTTDASGNYSLAVPVSWSGTVTPAFGGFVFAPGSRSYAGVSDDVANQNFVMAETIAASLNGVVSGTNLFFNWNGLTGVTYQLYATTNLVSPVWLPVGASLPGATGAMQMQLPLGTEPERYFRLGAQN